MNGRFIVCTHLHLPRLSKLIVTPARQGLVWFTGLSGSGKSTLAHALEERLFNMGIRSYQVKFTKRLHSVFN